MTETDCHALNDRFISWMENEYMKSGYTEAMDFAEYLWRFSGGLRKKWEAENALQLVRVLDGMVSHEKVQ